MLSLIRERVRAGVDVRVIGHVAKAGATITWAPLNGRRLHARAMVADGRRAFIGSQSLKGLELDKRREVGLDHPRSRHRQTDGIRVRGRLGQVVQGGELKAR